jgi:hypothetical protein
VTTQYASVQAHKYQPILGISVKGPSVAGYELYFWLAGRGIRCLEAAQKEIGGDMGRKQILEDMIPRPEYEGL